MITEYELYSDERYVGHDGRRYLFLGGIICTNRGRTRLLEQLKATRSKYGLEREMRWGKVSARYLDGYCDWVDSFFYDQHARYSVLQIDRSDPCWKTFQLRGTRRPSKDDRLVSGFYQFLLVTFGPLRDTKRWWVYPDSGFFSHDNVLGRVEFLFNRTYKKAFGPKTSRIIRLARTRDSKHEDLVQLADVLLGALSWAALDRLPQSLPKRKLVEHCIAEMQKTPTTRSALAKVTFEKWVPPDRFQYR